MMRFNKNFSLFLLLFIPFFLLGAIGASLLKPSVDPHQNTEFSTMPAIKSTQTNILVYKEKINAEGRFFPETIDILLITRNEKINLNFIHLFPTPNENSDLILVNDIQEFLKNHSMTDLIDFFNIRENISVNGMVRFNELVEKSFYEWMLISEGYQVNDFPSKGLVKSFCEQLNMKAIHSIGNLNMYSLQPQHLSIILDTFTRFHFKYIFNSALSFENCELIN